MPLTYLLDAVPVLWFCVAGIVACTVALFAVRDIRTLAWRSGPAERKVER